MDNFASLLDRLEPPDLEEAITVALIDDGIDIDDPILRPSIVAGRSFCSRDVEQNLNEPYYVSSGGHGTAMASLICRVCPNVKLYVLKLDEYRSELGKRQITAESAAKVVLVKIAMYHTQRPEVLQANKQPFRPFEQLLSEACI
jgi:hypothetical protein